MAMVNTFTDEALEKALIENGGMPTKAAKALGVEYTTVYRRMLENERLQAIRKAANSRLFDDLSDLTISAVKTGLMPRLTTNKEGEIVRDFDGKPVTVHVGVDTDTRLNIAAKLMGVLKSDAGIVDKSEVDHKSGGKPISGVMLID